MSKKTFNYNIAFTQAVNVPEASTQLTPEELWYGIKRGGRHPTDFAAYVAKCDIIEEEDKHHFSRLLTLANGAVHTAAGETLDQEVVIAPMLHVESRTKTTGAKSTFLLSYNTDESEKPGTDTPPLFLTAMYELWLENVEPGTQAAKDIETNYRALAKKACSDAVRDIREWKLEGKLARWAKE